MLKIMGRELKRSLRGGKFLYLIAILAAAVIYAVYGAKAGGASGTLSEMFCGAGSFGFIAVFMAFYTTASFEEDAKRGIAGEAAAVSGNRASFFSGKMLGVYILTAIMTALAAASVHAASNAAGLQLTPDTGNTALAGVIFFEAAALISTIAGFTAYASGKPSYGLYVTAVLYFAPRYIQSFVMDRSGVDISKYEILSCASGLRTVDASALQVTAGIGAAYVLAVWLVFCLAAGRRKAGSRA
jgi:hypothetical protein